MLLDNLLNFAFLLFLIGLTYFFIYGEKKMQNIFIKFYVSKA